jgi:hypothetical protein
MAPRCGAGSQRTTCHPERSPAHFPSRPANAGRARDAERDLLLGL